MHGNASAKDILRREMREKLRALLPEEIEEASSRIRAQLHFERGETVAFFAGLPGEPRLLPLIREYPETRWHLPIVTGKHSMTFVKVDADTPLEPGPFGILQPPPGKNITSFDTILCPGLAFTKEGARLGQGGGFYDHFLQGNQKARLVGIAFQCQLLQSLPQDQHDIVMHEIVTS